MALPAKVFKFGALNMIWLMDVGLIRFRTLMRKREKDAQTYAYFQKLFGTSFIFPSLPIQFISREFSHSLIDKPSPETSPSPSCKNTILASAYVFVTTTLPSSSWTIVQRILGPKCTGFLLRVINWIGYERNPLVQIFFLLLLTAGVFLFFIFGWSRIPNVSVPGYHKSLIVFSVFQAYASFFIACLSDPGMISSRNARECLSYYPIDNMIFSLKACKTCKFIKPARSKHCSMCGGCIMRLDHHCIWINSCVGHGNVHYFIYFLCSVLWVCSYGSYLCCTLASQKVNHDLFVKHGVGIGITLAFMFEPGLVSLGIFIFVAALLVLFFLMYFLYLNVWKGMTTNESIKWDDLEWMLKKGYLHVGEKDGILYLSKEPCPSPRAFKDLINIYDRGIFWNFKEILWPARLPASMHDADSSMSDYDFIQGENLNANHVLDPAQGILAKNKKQKKRKSKSQ